MEQRKDMPAFPSTIEWQADMRGKAANTGYRVTSGAEGMTLRDYFAAKAMQGLLASWGSHDVEDFREIADDAYNVADAMLVAREK